MADFHKPPPTTTAYPVVYATPVETVVYMEPTEGYYAAPGQARQRNTTEQGVLVGAWSADFWGCFDNMVPNCLMVTCCPCVSLAQISARLGVASYRLVLVIFLVVTLAEIGAVFYPSSSPSGTWYRSNTGAWYQSSSTRSASTSERDTNPVLSWVYAVARTIVFVFVWHLRQTTRRMFSIPGGACGDCWASCCCTCCAMAQIASHIKSYKPGDCSFGPLDVLPPYPAARSHP